MGMLLKETHRHRTVARSINRTTWVMGMKQIYVVIALGNPPKPGFPRCEMDFATIHGRNTTGADKNPFSKPKRNLLRTKNGIKCFFFHRKKSGPFPKARLSGFLSVFPVKKPGHPRKKKLKHCLNDHEESRALTHSKYLATNGSIFDPFGLRVENGSRGKFGTP